MKLLHGAYAALVIIALSGCVARETVAVDPHHDWWVQRHPSQTYDRAAAEREHRDYCQRSYDRSCEGWR